MEDVDLRVSHAPEGPSLSVVPGAVVHHVGSGLTGHHSAFSVYHGHRNLVWTWLKNMPGWWLWIYLPQHLLLTVASIARFTVIGQFKTIVQAKWDALLGVRAVLVERRRVQRRRTAPPQSIVAAMTRGWLVPYREHWHRWRKRA